MTIEEDFKKCCEEHSAELDAANKAALDAVKQLEALSEKYGIPYYASVSRLGQHYRPRSYDKLQEAYADLRGDDDEQDLFTQVTGDYPGEYVGWQHSAVCY